MRVTKATIKKAIKELGLKLEHFEIRGNQIETTLFIDGRAAEFGNQLVEKVVQHLADKGAAYHGFMTGYRSWIYRFEARSYSSELASMNID